MKKCIDLKRYNEIIYYSKKIEYVMVGYGNKNHNIL